MVLLVLIHVLVVMGFCVCSMFCCAVLCAISSFAIIFMGGGGERIGCFTLPYWSLVAVIVLWFFLAMLLVGLQCVIVIFPFYTHLLFLSIDNFPGSTIMLLER